MAIFYGSKEHTAKMAELFKNEIEKSRNNSMEILPTIQIYGTKSTISQDRILNFNNKKTNLS